MSFLTLRLLQSDEQDAVYTISGGEHDAPTTSDVNGAKPSYAYFPYAANKELAVASDAEDEDASTGMKLQITIHLKAC